MTTELVPYAAPAPAADTLALAPQAYELAQKIARTDFVPSSLRGKPEAIMAAILTGNEVGIGAMQALSKIHVIEGRPAMAAELMRALALRAGHEIVIEETNTTRCTVLGVRAGSSRETRITFTMDDAKRAGIDGKGNWRKYPAAMLLARATAALCRAVFPDVLAGISYTTEELEDGDVVHDEDLDEDGTAAPAPRKPRGRTRKATRAITGATKAADAPVEARPPAAAPPLPGEDDTFEPDQDLGAGDTGSPTLPFPQAAAMRAADLGVTDDADRHGLWLAITGGRVERAAELTAEERTTALAVLETLKTGDAALGRNAPEGAVPAYLVVDVGGTVLHATEEPAPGSVYALIAPEAHVGKTWTAPEGQEAAQDAPGAAEAGSEVQPATETPPTPPPAAPTDEDFVTGDAWRAWMKAHGLKVADVIRAATDVAGERADGTAPPRNLTELAELDAGFGATIRARLAQD